MTGIDWMRVMFMSYSANTVSTLDSEPSVCGSEKTIDALSASAVASASALGASIRKRV